MMPMMVMCFILISRCRYLGQNRFVSKANEWSAVGSSNSLRSPHILFLLCERNPNLFLLPYLQVWNLSANPNTNKVAMVFYDYLKNLSQVRLKYCQEKVLGSQPASLPFSAQNISLAFLPSCSLYCQCLLLMYKSCFLTRTRIFCYVTLGPGISINFLLNGEK